MDCLYYGGFFIYALIGLGLCLAWWSETEHSWVDIGIFWMLLLGWPLVIVYLLARVVLHTGNRP